MLSMDGSKSFWELFLVNAALGIAGGISLPAIMAASVIEGRRNNAMGSVMGILALAHSVGMLAGPMIAGTFLDYSSFKTIFLIGAAIMGMGTIVFWRKGLTSVADEQRTDRNAVARSFLCCYPEQPFTDCDQVFLGWYNRYMKFSSVRTVPA